MLGASAQPWGRDPGLMEEIRSNTGFCMPVGKEAWSVSTGEEDNALICSGFQFLLVLIHFFAGSSIIGTSNHRQTCFRSMLRSRLPEQERPAEALP